MRRAPLAHPAAVALALSLLLRLVNAGSMGPGVPENITVTFLNPTTVKVSWSTTADLVEKYDVTYKPSDARIGESSMGPGVPENITVTFLNPTTVKVSWSTTADLVEKYDVTYKPSDAR
ncbi:tenascin-R-like [Ostrinia furnacalis]|uniref:tenascin-R-like n=1 Tax=Ostrinia furnacalis TaxID=93504 RepID=UPI00103EE450|nr:tenascin-R-like [Ostrinia furnacalis]